MTGIYKFTNKFDRKVYIGQAIDIEKRYKAHKNKTKGNSYFHNALKKYGFENFDFDVLIECPKENLDYWEKFYIRYYCSNIYEYGKEHGYNLTDGGQLRLSQESIKQGIEKRKQLYYSDQEFINKLSASQKKRFLDPEERYKCGSSKRGKKAWNKGIKGSNRGWLKDKELPQYLKDNLHKKHVGRIWITNGICDKQIYQDELDNYINLGYIRGRSKYTKR